MIRIIFCLFSGMRAPSFRCTERPEDGALILHYYSEREGLEHIVIGIVKAVASQLHGCQVEVNIIATKNDGIDHVQFSIIEKSKDGSKMAEPQSEEFESHSLENKVSPLTFCKAFPFHIVFDCNLRIRQVRIIRMRMSRNYQAYLMLYFGWKINLKWENRSLNSASMNSTLHRNAVSEIEL